MDTEFIQQFDQSMRRLNEVRQGIQSNIELKQNFTNNIKNSLTQISKRLKTLVSNITELKTRSEKLHGDINTNNIAINEKNMQCQQLQAQIAQLQSQHQTEIIKLNQEKQSLNEKTNEQQTKIDEYEKNLREITELQQQLTAEKDALRNELQGKGDDSAKHAQQIQELTLQAQQREKELTDQISQCENKINDFQVQLDVKESEIKRLNEQHQNTTGAAQNQTLNLQQQIEQLKQQNEELSQRIVAATQAILNATEDLEKLTSAVPNVASQEEVNSILQEIELSIQNISNVIQGQRAAAAKKTNSVAPNDNMVISVVDSISRQPINIQLGVLKTALKKKADQLKATNPKIDNKYQKALDKIASAKTPEDISKLLYGIVIKSTPEGITVKGGRRSKKNKKYKGGFTYKTTSRRKGMSSSLKSIRKSNSSNYSKKITR